MYSVISFCDPNTNAQTQILEKYATEPKASKPFLSQLHV